MKTLVLLSVLILPSSSWAGEHAPSPPERRAIQAGGAVGVASVRWSQLGESLSLAGPTLDARAAWPIGRHLHIGGQLGFYGLNGESPRDDDITFDGPRLVINRLPRLGRTTTMMAFLRWSHPTGWYVQPAGGFSRNHFAAYDTSGTIRAVESAELGLAFGVAAGREWRVASRLDVSVEGGYTRAGAEDSSAPRHILYIQAVPLLRIGGR